MLERKKIFLILLTILFLIHTYLIYPGVYILFRYINSRPAPSLPKNGIQLDFVIAILIFVSSYFIIYFFLKIVFQPNKIRKFVILVLLALIAFGYWSINIYRFYYGWFENTFTTEKKVFWGPFKPEWVIQDSESAQSIGSLRMLTYSSERAEKLKNVFSDIDTDDWILTTINMHHRASHWESHSNFEFLNDTAITKLENFDKRYLKFLFDKKTSRKTIPQMFDHDQPVYNEFRRYLNLNSIDSDSLILKQLYSKIDSTIAKLH